MQKAMQQNPGWARTVVSEELVAILSSLVAYYM